MSLLRTPPPSLLLQSDGSDSKERYERAMADPEIAFIMADPMVNQAIKDLQTDPRAASARVMKDPSMMAKLNKLQAAGILKMG